MKMMRRTPPRYRWVGMFVLVLVALMTSGALCAQSRIRPPDFDVPYELPPTQIPLPQSSVQEIVDVLALAAALGLASLLVLKVRSRTWLTALSIAALLYFGFYRKGCVCSVGAIQNVTLALAQSTYCIPITVVIFFVLPMVFALLFGRVFCAAVCPLGIMQDVVLLKPIRLPDWLRNALSVIPFLYLGVAVMLAATGTGFIICRFDPFVPFFRLSGPLHMLIAGAGVLAVSTVIGRPYCRFVCPYGALLGLLSRISWKHVTITPDDCVICGLCEDACPFDAIRKPTTEQEDTLVRKSSGARKAIVTLLVFILPMMGAGLGALSGPFISRTHGLVKVARRIHMENTEGIKEFSFESEAFRSIGIPVSRLYAAARRVERKFVIGNAILGAWFGLVFGLKFFALNRTPVRDTYTIDRAECVSCARCFKSCPRERDRLKGKQAKEPPKGA